jgi:hypothetical protein
MQFREKVVLSRLVDKGFNLPSRSFCYTVLDTDFENTAFPAVALAVDSSTSLVSLSNENDAESDSSDTILNSTL